jgi:glycosyltransferase involved in cell wall biosynthesis/GT2 family glycosyltransferase
MSLRVLLALHHRLTPGAGAPGATLALGVALSQLGCTVDYFGFEHAFGHDSGDSLASGIKFPWKLAAFLRQRAIDFDVLDVSTGDAWVWARRGRPGAMEGTALITRSHGLEHTVDRWQREDARAGKTQLSWKYPLYHGGVRLWEVRQSLRLSDHVLLLNEFDRQLATADLQIPANNISLVPNGISDRFLGLPEPADETCVDESPIELAAVGTWIERKGKRIVVDVIAALHAANVKFSLTLLGTGFESEIVLAEFPSAVRPFVTVIPRYCNEDLPTLLLGQHVLLMCSFTEGYALSLPEAMACGLAPIASDVGAAATLITPGVNGELVPAGDANAVVAAVVRLASDRNTLLGMRRLARQTVQSHGWSDVARHTIGIYEQVLRRVRGGVAIPPDEDLLSATPALWRRDGKPTISLCICTANRPQVLRRCLQSIAQGQALPAEVIVGDDSTDGWETAAVCGEFSFVRYVGGPRRGLCANRNAVIAAAAGEYVSLLDDDGEVTPSFVCQAQDLAARSDSRTIFTGDVMESGTHRVAPSNPTFWGHFGRPLRAAGACETVQLNCNLFPRCAFDTAGFDEQIVYGYEDMDLCQQLLAAGFRIEYHPQLLNLHLPPVKTGQTKQAQVRLAERARYYTSLKRYLLWQRKPLKGWAFAAVAPVHEAVHHLRHRRVGESLRGFVDVCWALDRVWAGRTEPRVRTFSPMESSTEGLHVSS